ncbi:hypothetical protein [Nonomuraea sp. NPDC049695]|uniref:hypothetical protein n=1 Tax=Nonomuraea sp. NPDC049695 TaxID=3154734 RepID=UPI003445093E
MHGLYQGVAVQGRIPFVAMVNDRCVTGWEELPMPAVRMCSAWNRILAEPPGSDIYDGNEVYAGLKNAFPEGARWQAWPVYAVLKGWLAYAEVMLTRADLADLLGPGVEPSVQQLKALITRLGLPVAVVEEEARLDRTGVMSGKIRVGRTEKMGELWKIAELQHAYRQALGTLYADVKAGDKTDDEAGDEVSAYRQALLPALAERQCAALYRCRDVPVAAFAEQPAMLAEVETAVMGLVIGYPPGLTAMMIASTLMTPESWAYYEQPVVQPAVVL